MKCMRYIAHLINFREFRGSRSTLSRTLRARATSFRSIFCLSIRESFLPRNFPAIRLTCTLLLDYVTPANIALAINSDQNRPLHVRQRENYNAKNIQSFPFEAGYGDTPKILPAGSAIYCACLFHSIVGVVCPLPAHWLRFRSHTPRSWAMNGAWSDFMHLA